MAKIGNESKLIIRLAKEKMSRWNRRIQEDVNAPVEGKSAFQYAHNNWMDTLDGVVKELEAD